FPRRDDRLGQRVRQRPYERSADESRGVPECAFHHRQTARDSEPRELLGQRTPGGCLNDSERVAESALLLGPRYHCGRAALVWASAVADVERQPAGWQVHWKRPRSCETRKQQLEQRVPALRPKSGNASQFEFGIGAQTRQLGWLD